MLITTKISAATLAILSFATSTQACLKLAGYISNGTPRGVGVLQMTVSMTDNDVDICEGTQFKSVVNAHTWTFGSNGGAGTLTIENNGKGPAVWVPGDGRTLQFDLSNDNGDWYHAQSFTALEYGCPPGTIAKDFKELITE